MARPFLLHLFNGYLALTLVLGVSLISLLAEAEGPAGFYAQICGSGESIFTSLQGDEKPPPSAPHVTACHAICGNEDLDSDEDEA